MTSVRLPDKIEQKLNKLCVKTRRTKSFYIKEALEIYFEDLEDGYTALQRLNDRKSEYVSGKELLKSIKNAKK